MVEFRYDDLVCRNWPLIRPNQQEKIKNTRLLVAGCGTGSVTAEAAVRMGFEHLVVVDGDNVTVANMNRQAFEFPDVGKNKAEALTQKLKRINPQCTITTVPEFLDSLNVIALVDQCDIVIDAIDVFDVNAILALHREARNQGKPIATGVNFGWGAAAMVFTPDSMRIDEMLTHYLHVPANELLEANMAELLLSMRSVIPDYILKAFSDLPQRGPRVRDVGAEFAQPVVAALQCVTLEITAIVRLTLGLPVPVAPHPVYVDPWLLFILS